MEMKHRKNLLGSRLNARDVFRWKMCVMEGKKWNGARGVFSVLPACWGGGGAGCRHTTSAPPQELGSASQTASPAPAPRPAGRPYSHTAPFTRWEQSRSEHRTGQDKGQHQRAEEIQTNTGISLKNRHINHPCRQI